MFEDQGYKLYKKKKKPDSLTITDIGKKVLVFETNFSNWGGEDEISIVDLDKTIPPMSPQGYRGDFVFKRISFNDRKIVRVMLKKPWNNERPVIQFGYCIQPDGLNLKVKDGDIISFVASARLNEGRSAQLFVQDKTDYWSRESVSWNGEKWQKVLVRKKIRGNFTDICMGVEWNPTSIDDWLDLKLVQIFLDNRKKSQ